MKIAGLPLHPLVVHAAVVLTPLAVTMAVLFVVMPRWRYLTRWPTAVTTVISFGAVWASRLTGSAFLNDRPELRPLVRVHQSRADLLSLLMILFLVVVAVAVWGLGGESGLTSGAGARETTVAVLDRALPVVVILVSLVVLVWLVLTGDAGARAVWGG